MICTKNVFTYFQMYNGIRYSNDFDSKRWVVLLGDVSVAGTKI